MRDKGVELEIGVVFFFFLEHIKTNHKFAINMDSLTLKSSGMRSFDVRRKFKIYLNICPSLSMK